MIAAMTATVAALWPWLLALAVVAGCSFIRDRRTADRIEAAYELGVEAGYAEGWSAYGRQYNANDVRWVS